MNDENWPEEKQYVEDKVREADEVGTSGKNYWKTQAFRQIRNNKLWTIKKK